MIISPLFDKSHPALLKITERRLLTDTRVENQTFHLTLDCKGISLPFKVGDSIGIFAENDPFLVAHLVEALGKKASEIVTCPRSHETMTLTEFLTRKANLARLTSSFLKLLYTHEVTQEKKERLSSLLAPENKSDLTFYLKQSDPLDLFKEYAGNHIPLQEICNLFGPLLPRFYSIASSPLTHPDEIHLTVALSSFTHAGEIRYGVASHFLCHLAIPHDTPIPAYIQKTPHFTLPEDNTAPIIMVGPGTGVAPFRAFLQERKARKASGKNWLFFGERHRAYNYLYEHDLEAFTENNFLKLDLAFSRDQQEKDYVWHAMLRNQKELWQWISQGAYFFVCGDAEKMAKDVERTLTEIIAAESQCSLTAAHDYIKAMRKSGRYLADVY